MYFNGQKQICKRVILFEISHLIIGNREWQISTDVLTTQYLGKKIPTLWCLVENYFTFCVKWTCFEMVFHLSCFEMVLQGIFILQFFEFSVLVETFFALIDNNDFTVSIFIVLPMFTLLLFQTVWSIGKKMSFWFAFSLRAC